MLALPIVARDALTEVVAQKTMATSHHVHGNKRPQPWQQSHNHGNKAITMVTMPHPDTLSFCGPHKNCSHKCQLHKVYNKKYRGNITQGKKKKKKVEKIINLSKKLLFYLLSKCIMSC